MQIQPMRESATIPSILRPVALALAVGLSLSVAVAAPSAPVETVSGPARVVDGDTLDIAGTRVRLEGIDAPEAAQTCAGGWLGHWSCGTKATNALDRLVKGGDVRCDGMGRDKYGRLLGICYAGSVEINAALVRDGHAWAFVKYSARYVEVEKEARAAKRGIWSAETEPAWVYREKQWQVAEQTAPAGCAIKGNVSKTGRIYHMPWSPWYAKVMIEEARGERWFCTEAEAIAEGWRAAHGS